MSFHDRNMKDIIYAAKPYATSEEQLVISHLPLVRKLAWHVHGRVSTAIEIEDLLQIGMVALVEAARSFEDRGLGFSNYAKLRVRGAMIDQLRKVSNLSRSAIDFRKRLRQMEEKLRVASGETPDEIALAQALGMDQQSFRIAVDQAESIDLSSIDELYSDHNIWFADQDDNAEIQLQDSQKRAQLAQAIAFLPQREAMVLQLYFVEEMNLEEIGMTLDIGAARVCQIKKSALEKVKLMLVDQGQEGPLI